jgi:hypothetical protein
LPVWEPGSVGWFPHPRLPVREGVQTGHATRMKAGSAAIAIDSSSQLFNPGLYIL